MKKFFSTYWIMMSCFAVLNVVMYYSIKKFWIGGSSFLPMIGTFGPGNKFIFAFVVNVGVILGSFIGSISFNEFKIRMPLKKHLWKGVLGGFLIGMGVTICPGTCTTAFVTGIPMLSASSFLSAVGIFLGAYVVYSFLID